MVTQSTNEKDLIEELLLDHNEEVVKSIHWHSRKNFTMPFLRRLFKGKCGNWDDVYPTPDFDFKVKTRRNNLFVVHTAIELENHIPYISTMVFAKIPIRYEYKSAQGKGGVTRDGFEYVLVPPETNRLHIISPHFLDRLNQRSKIFNEIKEKFGFDSSIATYAYLSVKFRPSFYIDRYSEIDTSYAEEFLSNYGDDEEVTEYMEKDDVPVYFLDGYAIVKKSDAGISPGVIKTFIAKKKEDMRESDKKLMELIDKVPHRAIPVMNRKW